MMAQFTFKSKILSGLIAVLLCGVFIFWNITHAAKKFSLSKISTFIPNHPEWDVPFTSAEQETLHRILNQRFSYLGVGVQTFAFTSQDGKYVIKFFKDPSIASTEKRQKRIDKLIIALDSYCMAYREIREDTGLLFIHLTPTGHLQKTVMVSDRSGKTHLIDLDKTPFIIQEKAELIFDRFKRLILRRDAQGLKHSVAAVLALVERRIQKGFTDDDKAVTHNYGFVGDRPIHFDIGRMHKGKREGEYEHIANRIDSWLLQDAEK